jgi:MoaA/NifB/PqqE/SkfB family radical SAM enzyme
MNPFLLTHAPLLVRRRSLVPKLIRNYWRLLIHHEPVLRTADLAVTPLCNCACEHCYAQPIVDESRTPLSLAEKKRVVREALDLGAVTVNFVGGDPLCDPELEQLVAAVPAAEAVPVVTTNAVLLDEARLDRLIEAGLGVLAVSLDDPEPAVHDAFRHREGAYRQAIKAVAAAERRGLECLIDSTVSEAQLLDGRVARLVQMAREHRAKINLSLPLPVGRWARHDVEKLSPRAAAELTRLRGLAHVRWDERYNYLTPGCGAGSEKLAVTAYGDVLPCVAIHVTFGNIRERPLREIWREMRAHPRFARVTGSCPLVEDADFIDACLRLARSSQPKPIPAADFLK